MCRCFFLLDNPEDEAEDESKRKWNMVEEAHCYLDDGDVWPIFSAKFILCAGPESGHLAHLAGKDSNCAINKGQKSPLVVVCYDWIFLGLFECRYFKIFK